jgi:lipopolysaccharide transport system ATP-binding protein
MTDIALSIQGLSKRYRLGSGPAGKGDFREAAVGLLGGLRHRLTGRSDTREDADRELWALKDISFDVPRGTVMGLIGHNGAGKSTLLKILSRITDPTSGSAWIDGRVGSLLEVGTGFHPELTGRENIYLNGAILGMTQREIDAKFDQIVAFSEIGRFLDTPVKRYSSGMYVRLAFAVAAHLEPEILVIDEVLAVGDAAFQQKCLTKMQELAGGGRTILFVSHNMGSIQTLCDRAVVLSGGRVIGVDEPAAAVKLYLQMMNKDDGVPLAERTDRNGRGFTRLVDAEIATPGHEEAAGTLIHGEPARIRFTASEKLADMECKFTIFTRLQQPVCRFISRAVAPGDAVIDGRDYVCEIEALSLVPGDYSINASLYSPQGLEDRLENILRFSVQHGKLHGRSIAKEQESVIFSPAHRWETPRLDGATEPAG